MKIELEVRQVAKHLVSLLQDHSLEILNFEGCRRDENTMCTGENRQKDADDTATTTTNVMKTANTTLLRSDTCARDNHFFAVRRNQPHRLVLAKES